MDGALYAEAARRSPIDVLKITPSHLSALLAGGGADVLPRRYLVTGGEASSWESVGEVRAMSRSKLDQPLRTHRDDRRILDARPRSRGVAGPTAHGGAPDRPADRQHPPLHPRRGAARGRAGWRVGELYIAGAGVAAGYLKQPERTAERFLPEPGRAGRAHVPNRRSGAAAPDGAIEFLGRVDHQVKIGASGSSSARSRPRWRSARVFERRSS